MSRGFTLVELLVVMSVVGIISLGIVTAYPSVRAEQKLTLAEQTLQAVLRSAEQAAINEERPQECVEKIPSELTKLCSDTGVVLLPAENKMILFADTFEADKNEYNSGKNEDWPVGEVPFPEGVTLEPASPPTVFIFEGKPPTIQLYSGTQEVKSFVPVVLRSGTATRSLRVGSYGQVEH